MTNIAKTAILGKYDYFLLTIEEYITIIIIIIIIIIGAEIP